MGHVSGARVAGGAGVCERRAGVHGSSVGTPQDLAVVSLDRVDLGARLASAPGVMVAGVSMGGAHGRWGAERDDGQQGAGARSGLLTAASATASAHWCTKA
eukprot:4409642-Prymnesium_polylepis.1